MKIELKQEDFEAVLSTATSPSDISKYFADNYSWEFDSWEEECAATAKAAERAIELVASVSDGIKLFLSFNTVNAVVTAEQDTRLFNKIIELTTNSVEMDLVYDTFIVSYFDEYITYRNHIRKIFDKADELGLEAMTYIRK